MKIRFCGGAQTVTGSQHLLMINGKRILLECGLFQGRRKDTYAKNHHFSYNPADVDVMLVSHAHIDHSGNIPNLVKKGFSGPVYATAATVDLCQFMLRDSAHLQEKDVEWVNRHRKHKNQKPVEPLYTMEDAEKALKHMVGVQYDRSVEIIPGVRATFRDAGHILGSASILLEIENGGKTIRFGFTGDLGRNDMPILRNPNRLRDLDFLMMESTYGNRLHQLSGDVEERLADLVRSVAHRGGKIIIPAFAVGRTQLIVYMLHKLFDQDRIPIMPIYVDSPLACNATDVFRMHPECFDRETHRIFLKDNEDPFGFRRLTYIRDVEKSKELNSLKFPHIIISASGMAEGGRILHHLRNNIGNSKNLVLFVGYAAQHTLARRLMDGEPVVKIFGEPHKVRCQIEKIDDFSAHADRGELLAYVEKFDRRRLKKFFLVHGEEDQALPFRDALLRLGFPSVEYPGPGQAFGLV